MPAPSIVDRLIARMGRSPASFIVKSAVVLLLLPLVIVWLDGYWGELFSQRYWRAIFLQPVIIIYILILERVFKRMEADVNNGLDEVVCLSDEAFDQLVRLVAEIYFD